MLSAWLQVTLGSMQVDDHGTEEQLLGLSIIILEPEKGT